ncbi:hypothetical protein BKA69DRAFT_1086078 [Paraphysoderma sedebokerense]|nr:hypothetical protein BKA69DRAFT_1086078 [Paraphysoderma sedebokerense]
MASVKEEHIAVTRFREFLRVKTVQPNPDYTSCLQFLQKYADELNLPVKTIELAPGKPIIILTWAGSDPQLQSVILNCHSDVVPVFEEHWNHPPFAADKTENGDIFARGSQDMKCVGIQYLEAIRVLKKKGFKPRRTFYICFVPDEEIGGHDGVELFVNTNEFKAMNVGLVLDEGLANPDNSYKVYYGERAPWWVRVIVKGQTGHGSQFIEDTAGPKLNRVISRFLEFRESELNRLNTEKHSDGRSLDIGDVTTINLTMLNGGVQFNVIPEELEVGFDIRISPDLPISKFEKMMKEWCSEPGVSYAFKQHTPANFVCPLTSNNPWWTAIQKTSGTLNAPITPAVFPASTDSRYFRRKGIPAIGISPMRNTPILLHCHNEYLNEKVFLDGVDWYECLLPNLDKVEGFVDPASLVIQC